MARRKRRVYYEDIPVAPKKRYRTFVTDDDGLSSKDYLILISTGVFFAFVAIGLVMALLNRDVSGMYLDLLEMVAPVVMTVVAGVMGVNAVESFRNPRPHDGSPEEPEFDDKEDDIV